MKTYTLRRGGEVVGTTRADNIDHALDCFFPSIKVDVDLDTYSETRLTARPLHGRKSRAFVIEERAQ